MLIKHMRLAAAIVAGGLLTSTVPAATINQDVTVGYTGYADDFLHAFDASVGHLQRIDIAYWIQNELNITMPSDQMTGSYDESWDAYLQLNSLANEVLYEHHDSGYITNIHYDLGNEVCLDSRNCVLYAPPLSRSFSITGVTTGLFVMPHEAFEDGTGFVGLWFSSAIIPAGFPPILGDFGVRGSVRVSYIFAVPEPASWVMMVGGFGLIGAANRYRRKPLMSFA